MVLLLSACAGSTGVAQAPTDTATVAIEPASSGFGNSNIDEEGMCSVDSGECGTETPGAPIIQKTVQISEPEPEAGTPAASLNILPTATLGVDDWQNFPVIPTQVSERAKEIYREGLALGTNPDRFSKIGDCQNINTYFLALYDQPDQYKLGEEYQYLLPAIEQFAGSWSRDSIAVKGGFNVASVFNPWFNNKELCDQNESPVDCELRLNKPSIVLISMETWWNGDASKYEGYLRRIVDTVIAYGAVPVLATKADNLEGNQTINRSIVKVAYEYQIPLWNYWAAVQPIPHHGLEEDGFHITHGLNDFSQSYNLTSAWPLRNLTALQTMDFVWQELQKP